jgi:hypothetical protein
MALCLLKVVIGLSQVALYIIQHLALHLDQVRKLLEQVK